MKKFAIMMAAALALPAAANAAAFVNGSFESASVNPGSGFTTLSAGATDITGWVVGGGSIDYIGGYWQAGDGARSVDLSGGNPGSVAQTFDTVAGQTYLVQFLLSGNPDGPPPSKTLRVSATGNASQDYVFTIVPGVTTRTDMGWISQSYSFTAASTSTTLTFLNASVATAYGPAIDKVSVTAVPEPTSWALMIGGLGFAGAFMRRRAPRSAIAFG